METLIGRPPEKFQASRTREAVAHAGPFPPLPLWKAPICKKVRPHSFPNRSLLTAPAHMATKAATEDGWIRLSLTSGTTKLTHRLIILTLPEMELAKRNKENTSSSHSLMLLDVTT